MKDETRTEQEKDLDLLVRQRRTVKEIMKMIPKMIPIFPKGQGNLSARYFQSILDHLNVMSLQVETREVEILPRREKLTSMRLKLTLTYNA